MPRYRVPVEAELSTFKSLVGEARQLGLGAGDIVMMHASLRALGPVLGGPDVLIDALLRAAAWDGTLMMYIGCQPPYDHIGRKPIDADEMAFLEANLPPFDPAAARADRDYGALAELFRTRAGAVCSTNPGARMAALGARAVWLTQDHPLDYGYGPGSPLAKLCEAGGKVLLIGSDLDEVTLLHYAEHLAPVANKRVLTHQAPIVGDDGGRWMTWREFDTTSRGIVDWPDRFFASIVEDFVAHGGAATGKLGQTRAVLFDARKLVDHAVPMMVETAAAVQRN